MHASVSIRNKLYVIGGTRRQQIEVYDSFSQVFVRILPKMPPFSYWYYSTECVAIGSKFFVFKKGKLDKNIVFDVERGEWSEVIKNISKTKPLQTFWLKLPKF